MDELYKEKIYLENYVITIEKDYYGIDGSQFYLFPYIHSPF